MPRSPRLRLGYGAMGLLMASTALSGVVAPTAVLARAPSLYIIGVDNAGPPGKIFEYVDYFPRDGVKVAPGDVIDFSWNPGSSDGAHTTSFLPRGAGIPPLVVPEPTGDEAGLQFNPDILFPSDPTCGSAKASPCVFDGSKAVNSGFMSNGNPTPPYLSDFYVTLDAKLLQGASSTAIKYVCEIHQGMAGTITLVSDPQEASDPVAVQSQGALQLVDDTTGALAAEKSANKSLVARNLDGSANITVTAGTATPFVEVVEMLPNTVTIKPGDTVTWVTKTLKDPHTVTFPSGPGSQSIDPLPAFCDGQSGDTLPSAVGPPCASMANFELHFLPQPMGTKSIGDASTLGTSGVIGSPADGLPNSFTFSFPNAGSFDYMCRIHDHMVGAIVAR